MRRSSLLVSVYFRKPSYLPGGNEPEVKRMARLSATPYCGRRGAPPTAVQNQLDPSKRWCTLCCMAVPQQEWVKHGKSWKHKANEKKEAKLEDFALELWERHRGAPVEEASFVEREGDAAQERWRRRMQGDKEMFNQRAKEAEVATSGRGVISPAAAKGLLMQPMRRFPTDRR